MIPKRTCDKLSGDLLKTVYINGTSIHSSAYQLGFLETFPKARRKFVNGKRISSDATHYSIIKFATCFLSALLIYHS